MTDTEPPKVTLPPVFRRRSLTPEDDDPRKPEIIPVTLQSGVEYGVLRVVIYQARGLLVPRWSAIDKYESNSANIGSSRSVIEGYTLPYAILEYEGSELSTSARSGTHENPQWLFRYRNFKHSGCTFDVFRTAELTIRLYARNPDYRNGDHDISLGYTQIRPMLGHEAQIEWLPVKNGTGELHVEVEYVKSKALRIETSRKPWHFGESRLGSVARVRKSDFFPCYAFLHFPKAELALGYDITQAPLSPINQNPFLAPLRFIAQTRSECCLYWPFVSGGHLFYRLQQVQRFEASRAKLYIAEILVALECIDEFHPSYYKLKPKNIHLDITGHVVICDIGLLNLEMTSIRTTDDVSLDYMAPELLSEDMPLMTDTTASKWWTLGVFLFEMLTGLPPFYHEDTQQRRRNILSDSLAMPKFLPVSTRDFLNKLLSHHPANRLGVAGASEIKSHCYFDGLDWTKVVRREYEPVKKPREKAMSFKQRPPPPPRPVSESDFARCTYNKPPEQQISPITGSVPETSVEPSIPPIPSLRESRFSATVECHAIADEKPEDWDLVRQPEHQLFYFYNHTTKTEQPIDPRLSNSSKRPDITQSQEALEAILKNKYMYLVPSLLEKHQVNLNFMLSFTHTTPLVYVTKLQEIDLVRLFIANGADADLNFDHRIGGASLLIAVQQGNQELVELLVRRTSRIPCTRALGHAVSKRDTAIINILCANGVECDFKDTYRRPPRGRVGQFDINDCCFMEDSSEPAEYMPPLVRAIYLADADLVRLLLAHGASANAGYHDCSFLVPDSRSTDDKYIKCGRPIQFAMDLGHKHIVRLLLENGADITLGRPVAQDHECAMIPREVYLQLTSQLRSIAAFSEDEV